MTNKKILKLNTAVVILVATITNHGIQAQPVKKSIIKEQQITFIKEIQLAQRYSWGIVGSPPEYTKTEIAIRILYDELTPTELYSTAKDASIEGKIYLLCALKRKKTKLYEKLKSEIQTQELDVTTFSGSILSKEPASSIISQIDKFNCDPLNYRID